jgi:hypothetical protein
MNAIPAPKYRIRKLAKSVVLFVTTLGFIFFMCEILNSVDWMDFLSALGLV